MTTASTRVPVLRSVAMVTLLLLLLCALLVGTFFLTARVYHAIGHAPPPVLAQLINSLLGIALCIVALVGLFTLMNARPQGQRRQRRQMGPFEPIFAAMEHIASGDFGVRLEYPSRGNVFARELARSVNQMALELDQMEHLRQEFISNVSHEIQSPLTSIRGFAQALRDEHLSALERVHYLDIIETESRRLSRMTDNMLKLAALEAERVHMESRRFRLDRQLRALIVACEPQWSSKALGMDVTLEEVELCGDEDLLSQVWSNLLQNSIKFTPEGGRVTVDLRRQGDAIHLSIADTGIGIPQDAQAHIFERFYKVDAARERSQEGSGLGLAIAKRIVELHRGTIGMTSHPGAGTTFNISLPLT
jgi:two-component system, OmpR family, phosphate regulon sensor histidine kinase PhoR